MTKAAGSRTAWLAGTGCVVSLAVWLTLGGRGPTLAQPKAAKSDGKYLGSSTCMGCHTTGPIGATDEDFVLLTEYATWRTQDKHSLAYFALESPRGQRMADALKLDVTKKEAGCLGCHAMGFVKEDRRGQDFDVRDGVSCDACHGPAEHWDTPHRQSRTWRVTPADDKQALGMNDLRDPVTRAQVCLSCHVGDAGQGKVVTHAMYAAGHPPLPNIEIALWSHRLPQHYRSKREVPCLVNPAGVRIKLDKDKIDALYHMAAADYQQSQLVTASSLVGLRSAMQFVAQRSDIQGAARGERWPETLMPFEDFKDKPPADLWPQLAMAQSDCSACHHELQRPSWRQLRGYPSWPGRVPLRAWPLALVNQSIGLKNGVAASGLSKELASLFAACDARPFGDPAKLVQAANGLVKWVDGQPELAKLQDATFDRLQLLRQLCTLGPNEYPDYESARQTVAAILVVSREGPPVSGKKKQADIQAILNSLQVEFNLQPPAGRRPRILLIRDQFTRLTKDRYLQVPGAAEALETISDHGLLEAFPIKGATKEQLAIGKDVRAFLNVIKDQGGPTLTDFLLDPKNKKEFLDALNEINETELRQALEKAGKYDPFTFKERLKALLALLS